MKFKLDENLFREGFVMKGKVEFTAEIFKEGEVYVSLCPEVERFELRRLG
jgi:hypothetical protein